MRKFSRRTRPVVVEASSSRLAHSDPPLLIRTSTRTQSSPPPLIRSRTAVVVGTSTLPRLIRTQANIKAKKVSSAGTGMTGIWASQEPSRTQPVELVTASSNPPSASVTAPAQTSRTCFIGAVYRVVCHRKYLGAQPGFKDWSELDAETRKAIHSKIQNQFKPGASDKICTHHLKEFSYVEEPDPTSADKDRGACSGYGIVHKLPVYTTRLGVLTYFNSIAGKNRDVLPGKFVCSTCINILRGNVDAFKPSKSNSAPVPVSASAEPIKRKSGPASASESGRNRRARFISPRSRLNKSRSDTSGPRPDEEQDTIPINGDDWAEEEAECKFSALRSSEIIITEFGAMTNGLLNGDEPEQDPLEPSRSPDPDMPLAEAPLQNEMEGIQIKTEPQPLGDETPRFQRLNTILAAAGVAPLQGSDSQDEQIIRSRAARKIRQLAQTCVRLCKKDGVEIQIDEKSFYNFLTP